MHPNLAAAILNLARVIRDSADAGEHPGAALRAARATYDTYRAMLNWQKTNPEWSDRLEGVVGGLEAACREYACDPERACEVALPCELHRMRHLIAMAEVTLKQEEVCA